MPHKKMKIAAFVFTALAGAAALLVFYNAYNRYRPAKVPPPAAREKQADKILVQKGQRKLLLLQNGKVIREYKIALGFAPVGDKLQEGDGKTPEGRYRISGRNPKSRFHLSLRVSYPDDEDRREAAAKGVSPGGDIMVHGLPNATPFLGHAHLLRDWTAGCIAVTNDEIEEIWSLVPNGTEIEILP